MTFEPSTIRSLTVPTLPRISISPPAVTVTPALGSASSLMPSTPLMKSMNSPSVVPNASTPSGSAAATAKV